MATKSTKKTTGKKAKSPKRGSKNAGARAPQLPESMPSFETEKEAIKTEWQKYKDAGKDAFAAARAMGEQLAGIRKWIRKCLEVKSKEQEPIWNVWCEKNLPFKRHQANRYIRVWNKGEELPFEGEITSVRAAIEVLAGRLPGGNNQETEKFKRVYGRGKHPAELIEAGLMGAYEGGTRSHRIRVTWCDDTLGKELSDIAGNKVQALPGGASKALQACAKLFGVALAVDDEKIADKLRKLMFDIWEQRQDKEVVSSLLNRLEQAMYPPSPPQQLVAQQLPDGTNASGMAGGTGAQGGVAAPSGQTYAQPAPV